MNTELIQVIETIPHGKYIGLSNMTNSIDGDELVA